MKVAVAVCALSTTFVLALAAAGANDPDFQPDVVVIPIPLNIPMTNSTMFVVPAPAAPLSITSIDPIGCAAGITASPQTITIGAGGGSEVVTVMCPAFGSYGIERCQFEAMSSTTTVATLTSLCVVQGNDTFTKSKDAMTWTGVQVGGASSQDQVTLTSPDAIQGLSLQLADDNGNFVIDEPCTPTGVTGCTAAIGSSAPGSVIVKARCTPQTEGPHMAQIYVVETVTGRHVFPAIQLDCMTTGGNGQDIRATPPSLTKMVPVNDTQTDIITIQNEGTIDSLVISNIAIAGSADWTITLPPSCQSGCTLAPSETFDIEAEFHPGVIATGLDATITITSNDPDESPLVIPLFGTGIGGGTQEIDASPSTISRIEPVGTMQGDMIVISNQGAQDNLVISNIQAISTAHWTIDLPVSCPAAGCTLGPSQDFIIHTTFHPTAVGTLNTTITITSDDPDEGTLVIDLLGTGTSGTDGLVATPPSIDLGNVRLDRPRSGSTNLSLAGTNSITIDSVTFAAGTTMQSGSVVTPSQQVNLIVSMAATAEGAFSTTATVNGTITGGGTTMLAIPVSGVGVRAEATVPAMIDAGSFCIGQPYTPVEVTLRSSGTATFDMVGKPTLTTGAAFAVSYTAPLESEYPRALAPNETARVAVSLKTPGIPGEHTDVLVWDTDLATDPTTMIRAALIDDGGAISPQMIDFEAQQLRLASAPRTITLQNCGTSPLALTGIAIDPSDEFRTSTTLPAQLAPLETTTVLVDFTPRVAGLRTATLTIDSPVGALEVQLAGTGIAGNITGGDRESLYACSCRSNDPRGFLVIAVAFAFLLLRPRRNLRYARH